MWRRREATNRGQHCIRLAQESSQDELRTISGIMRPSMSHQALPLQIVSYSLVKNGGAYRCRHGGVSKTPQSLSLNTVSMTIFMSWILSTGLHLPLIRHPLYQ